MNNDMLFAYLKRIKLKSEIKTDLKSLFALQQHQHQHIAFENLSIINGQEIKLEAEFLFEKLIHSNRGGYCFELNGLMHLVLNALQFNVEKKLARVHVSGEASGRGHLINIVTIDNELWLVDTGFGAHTPREPLPLRFDQELSTDTQTFRFIQDQNFGVMLQYLDVNQWLNLYSLDMSYVCQGDIEYGNHYSFTSKNSLFTNNLIAVVRTAHGSNILFNDSLKISNKNGVIEHQITDEHTYSYLLKEHFVLDNPVATEKLTAFLGSKSS